MCPSSDTHAGQNESQGDSLEGKPVSTPSLEPLGNPWVNSSSLGCLLN